MADSKRTSSRWWGLVVVVALFSLLLFATVNVTDASHASFSNPLGQTILDTPTDTPTPTASATACPAPVVSTNFLHVPYWGGLYYIDVDVGPNCSLSIFPSSWPDWVNLYCGALTDSIRCNFVIGNPSQNDRIGEIVACTDGPDCAYIRVLWDRPPTRTPTPTRTFTPTNIPTNTPIPPTATSTPTPPLGLIGHLTWQGIAQPHTRNVGIDGTLTLCAANVPHAYTASSDESGFFTTTINLPDGVYDWWFKGPKWLAAFGTLTILGGRAKHELGVQRAGDANDSNTADSQDYVILKNTYGKPPDDPNYDPRADFNNDNLCNVVDFNLHKLNFGVAGAQPVCLGGP